MTVRLVLSVVLAVALLAVATPALQDAGTAERSASGDRVVARVTQAADALVERSDPSPAGLPAASRTLALSLPPGGTLTVTSGSRVVRLHHEGRPATVAPLPVEAWTPGTQLDVSGRTSLTIRYVSRAGRPHLEFSRGFIRERAAKKGHGHATPPRRPTARSVDR